MLPTPGTGRVSPVRPRTAQRFTGAQHHQLDGTLWRTLTPDGRTVEQKVEPEKIGALLAETFDITLDESELAAVLGESGQR